MWNVDYGVAEEDITYPYAVTDAYVPVGSKEIKINDTTSFVMGDRIVIKLQTNDDWLLHMSDMAQWGWTLGDQPLWRREVVAKDDSTNTLFLDAPIVHPIENVYGGAIVYKYELLFENDTTGDILDVEIENVGVENMRIESTYNAANEEDENHGKSAVMVQRVTNGWIRQVTSRYFWQGLVFLRRFSYGITVEDSAALDPWASLASGRRYPFQIDDGQNHLLHRVFSNNARHGFSVGSLTPGPNVFADGSALNSYNDCGKFHFRTLFFLLKSSTHNMGGIRVELGPHLKLSTGQLYTNIRTNINENDHNDNGGEINVQNRGDSGSGHGWAGAQIVLWNSKATRWRVNSPNGGMSFAIGMEGEHGFDNRIPEPDGIIQSFGMPVTPRSLYYAQLQDRLGVNALHSVVLPSQRIGDIWDDLDAWQGGGLFGDALLVWAEDDKVSVPVWNPLNIGGMLRDLTLLDNSPSYNWGMSSGPGAVTFSDTSSLETSVTLERVGAYVLCLTASDGTTTHTAYLEAESTCGERTNPCSRHEDCCSGKCNKRKGCK
eukprot:scaffold37599_cov290-Amphora_coffeaeformis.AAC.1